MDIVKYNEHIEQSTGVKVSRKNCNVESMRQRSMQGQHGTRDARQWRI